MTEAIACATLVVRDYDEAVEYFTKALGFTLLEDSPLGDGKRWVVVAASGPNSSGSSTAPPRRSS